jgi:hypothetical protein
MNFCHVEAEAINPVQFSFTCPFCWTKPLTKRGLPRKGAKHMIHYHGSDGDLSNRWESRRPHCTSEPSERSFNEFIIHITDKTRRET